LETLHNEAEEQGELRHAELILGTQSC